MKSRTIIRLTTLAMAALVGAGAFAQTADKKMPSVNTLHLLLTITGQEEKIHLPNSHRRPNLCPWWSW